MDKDQTEIIIGLLSGMQTAVVHLSNVLCTHIGITPDDMATSFEETARAIPQDAKHRALLQKVLTQVAAGIRGSAASAEWAHIVSRLLR